MSVERAFTDLHELALKANKPKPAYDCKKCGACCAAFFVGPSGIMRIQLKPYDVAKLPKSYKKRLTKYEGGWTALRAVKRNGKYRCPALRGRVGQETRCAIYRNRPFNCKYFETDAELCRMARFEYGMPLREKTKIELEGS